MQDSHPLLEQLQRLQVFERGERRAPHKPLLVLVALGHLLHGRRELDFETVHRSLLPLLVAFAPPVKQSHEPERPYWHLRSDDIWLVHGADEMPRRRGRFPIIAALRESTAGLTPDVANALLADPSLRARSIQLLLDNHFPPSLHDDILEATGLSDQLLGQFAADSVSTVAGSRQRDPAFRRRVIRNYEHRCVVTGFRAALGGSYVGVEAAHVRAVCYDGPDLPSNGLALEPTMHKLYDAGAWTLTDDRRVLVSADFTGSDAAIDRLRRLHGNHIRSPLDAAHAVATEYIRWHREPTLGGIFRQPALPI